MTSNAFTFALYCVVPENSHTPPQREIILRPPSPGFSVSRGYSENPEIYNNQTHLPLGISKYTS